jgi:hypothetical protein
VLQRGQVVRAGRGAEMTSDGVQQLLAV